MGKKIDRFVLTSILAVILFLYFEAAFQRPMIALLLAMVTCVLILKILRRLCQWIAHTKWQQRRCLKRKSSGELMELACMDTESAIARTSSLLEKGFQNEAEIVLEQLHPSIQLSQERIFEIWRKHRGLEKLVICTTGKCSAEASILASSLSKPKIAVVDASVLSQLISEYPDGFFTTVHEKKRYSLRLNHVVHLIFNRRNAPRGILFSLSMLVMYVFSGNIYYLAGSLLLLFTVLVSFRQKQRPAKLF